MGKVQENIDARQYRKSTHLAAADLDIMQQQGKPLIFRINKVWYEEDVNVSGEKKDGYFCNFSDPSIKPWMINSTNRTVLASFAGKAGHDHVAKWNIGNWQGMLIELYALRDLKAFGKVQDAIRVVSIQPKEAEKKKTEFIESMFEAAHKNDVSIEKIKETRLVTPEIEKAYNEYRSTNKSGK